jgi:hypothetical protein
MRSPRVLISAWKNIVLDFVVKLLSSKKALIGVTYNSILVVINRLTKYAHFIFYKKGLTAEELIYAFNRNIIPCVTEYPGLVRFLFGTFAWQADHATSKH